MQMHVELYGARNVNNHRRDSSAPLLPRLSLSLSLKPVDYRRYPLA